MGKKKSQKINGDDFEEIDPELQAEINAVLSMKNEKKLDPSDSEPSSQDLKDNANTFPYNSEGLNNSIQEISHDLSFIESMIVDEYNLDDLDENDDIQREVNLIQRIFILNSLI